MVCMCEDGLYVWEWFGCVNGLYVWDHGLDV